MGLGLLFKGLHELGLFQGHSVIKERSFLYRKYYGASSVPLLYDSDSSSNSEPDLENKAVIQVRRSHSCKARELYSVVGRVCKCLNWKAVKEIPFRTALKKYGLDQSMNAFSTMIGVFAFAGLHKEVYYLFEGIVFDFQDAGIDLGNVMFVALQSISSDDTRSALVIDVLIKVFAANKLLGHATDVVMQAKEIGYEPSIYSCNFLLKCLAEASEGENLRTLFEAMKNFGPSPNVRTYTIMMNFYCTNHPVDLKAAYEILKEMQKNKISPSAATFSVWIRGLCRVGCVDVAWKFIRKLRYENQPLNSYCFNAIIHRFFSDGEASKAITVFEEMTSSGIAPDACSYSILIDGLCKFENIDGGLCCIQDMQTNNIQPTPIIYSSILKGLCEIGAVKMANDCFHGLKNHGCKVDQIAYNVLITGFCAQGDLSSAHELLEEMISNNLAPDASIFKRLIRASCLVGSVDTAMNYQNMMVQVGFIPDLRTYNIVIHRLCKDINTKKALELVTVMFKRDMFPNVIILNTLLDGFIKELNFKKAGILYRGMLKLEISPDVATYTILIDMLCKRGKVTKACRQIKVKKAYKVFRKMFEDGLKPDNICYTSMIAGLCTVEDVNKACALFREMQKSEILPTVVTYTCLIDTFCKLDQMDEAKELFKMMRSQGIPPDVRTYSCLIDKFCKLHRMDEAKSLFDRMRKENISPDIVTYEIMIKGYNRVGNFDLAYEMTDEMQTVFNISVDSI